MQVGVSVLLFEDELGRAEEVQSQHAATYLFTIDFERHIKRDVSGSVRQNHFNGIVLSQEHIVVVQERDLQRVHVVAFRDSVQVILCRHLVAHVPVSFPATADRVARKVVHVDILFLSYSVSARNVAYVVMKVKVLDVPGVLGGDHLHAILAVALLVEVDTIEFALEMSADVLQLEVLVHPDEAPMAHMHSLAGLS